MGREVPKINYLVVKSKSPGIPAKKKKRTKCLHLRKLSVKSPSFSPPIPSDFTPYPLFQWYPQSKEILFNAYLMHNVQELYR
jgi:hypothetical protein